MGEGGPSYDPTGLIPDDSGDHSDGAETVSGNDRAEHKRIPMLNFQDALKRAIEAKQRAKASAMAVESDGIAEDTASNPIVEEALSDVELSEKTQEIIAGFGTKYPGMVSARFNPGDKVFGIEQMDGYQSYAKIPGENFQRGSQDNGNRDRIFLEKRRCETGQYGYDYKKSEMFPTERRAQMEGKKNIQIFVVKSSEPEADGNDTCLVVEYPCSRPDRAGRFSSGMFVSKMTELDAAILVENIIQTPQKVIDRLLQNLNPGFPAIAPLNDDYTGIERVGLEVKGSLDQRFDVAFRSAAAEETEARFISKE